MLFVNEIFFSIQGESTHTGLPCAFIRLTGCNLRCSYCDTSYAYDEGTWMSLQEIDSAIHSMGTGLVEVTGGEPLLQESCSDLLSHLTRKGYKVLIETNGSQDIRNLPEEVICILDMKCPSSGMNNQMFMDNLKHLREKDELKFVIQNRDDYDWAKQCLGQLPSRISMDKVLFSPVHETLDPQLLAEWILVDNLPVRMHLPIHPILWPDKARGK